jgi:hypothetical protein
MKLHYKEFMSQFDAARKEIESLPDFLKESIRRASLTYPTAKPAEAPGLRRPKTPVKKP